MSDLIDRQEAIETLENLTCYGIDEMRNLCDASVSDSEGWLGGIKDAIDELQLLPSAEQKQEWWCNLCASYDKSSCYCNLHGIWVPSDFGCKSFGAYCDEEENEDA